MPSGVQKTPDRKVVGSPGVQGSPKKMEQTAGKPGAGATTSEGVLANFFNSLLSKKTGGMAGAGQGQPGSLAYPSGQAASPGPGAPPPDDCKLNFLHDQKSLFQLNKTNLELNWSHRPLTHLTFDLGPTIDKAAVRSDAAAELDRLTRNQKKSVSNTSSVEGEVVSSSQPASSTDC